MKVRREVLKARTIILLAGAMAIVAGTATGAAAADMTPILKAPPPEMGWYFHGGFDAGGRFYAERPGSGFGYDPSGNFLLPTQTDSRAKYEEYGKVPPGVFLDWIHLDIGSNDGRYRINFWGDDVGYNAQSYSLDFSEAGKQYLTLGWDQTPHLWSYSAKSLFGGVGSTNLTVSDAVQAQLQPLWASAAGTLASRQAINTIINRTLPRSTRSACGATGSPPPIATRRRRHGTSGSATRMTSARGRGRASTNYNAGTSFPSNTIGMPIPVDDVTHTPKASGEYDGASSWGRYSFKLGYAGSIYHDNLTVLNAENPFGQTGGLINFGNGTIRAPLPPSNEMHGVTASGAFDIPVFMSRFTTTNQYTRRTQDAAFIDTSNNGHTADALPASSLNGEVTTFLTNNVLTSKLTDTLHNKIRVRYYDFKNKTANLEFGAVVLADSELSAGPFETEYLSYKKTNVDEDLTWNPVRWLTVGAGYGYEHWHRDNRFTTNTSENVGRGFFNAQLTDWAQWRGSYSYGSRRYSGEYFIDDGAWLNSRMFDLANRNQQKARTLLDITVTDAITITPNAGLRWDDYPDDAVNPAGVKSKHSWNAGVDLGVVVSPALRFSAGYNFERDKLDMTAYVADAAGTAAGNACGFLGYAYAGAPYTVPQGAAGATISPRPTTRWLLRPTGRRSPTRSTSGSGMPSPGRASRTTSRRARSTTAIVTASAAHQPRRSTCRGRTTPTCTSGLTRPPATTSARKCCRSWAGRARSSPSCTTATSTMTARSGSPTPSTRISGTPRARITAAPPARPSWPMTTRTTRHS